MWAAGQPSVAWFGRVLFLQFVVITYTSPSRCSGSSLPGCRRPFPDVSPGSKPSRRLPCWPLPSRPVHRMQGATVRRACRLHKAPVAEKQCRRGPVPRLHQMGVVFIESFPFKSSADGILFVEADSGTSMAMVCGRLKAPHDEKLEHCPARIVAMPGCTMGDSPGCLPRRRGEYTSRAFIHARLPGGWCLISLAARASRRKGCASPQVGKCLVLGTGVHQCLPACWVK